MDREECLYTVDTGTSPIPVHIAEGERQEPGLSAACPPDDCADEADSSAVCADGADSSAAPVTELPYAVRPDGEAAGDLAPAQIIEALLFASDTPLSANRLAELLGRGSVTAVRLLLAELNDKYVAAGLAFRIVEIARGYQMMTLPAYRPWLVKLHAQRSQTRLSAAALETLSIVAYKQPIIRADIEAIRGVACGEVLNRLREMGLVKIVGRAEIVGRPMLYGTTRKFLDVFGLADLDDLPPMETLSLRRSAPPAAILGEPTAAEPGSAEIPVAAAGA